MNRFIVLLGLCSGLLEACATRVAPTSGSYNEYNEDLSVVRPVYTNSAEPVSRDRATPGSPQTSTTSTVAASEPRKVVIGNAEAQHINKRLEEQLELIADRNRSIRYAPGYRIQIYVGNERQQAEAAKMSLYQNFPELSPYLSYKQPTYRLKAGDFMRRLDAERYVSQLRQLFTSAIMQPDKVDVRRSLLVK